MTLREQPLGMKLVGAQQVIATDSDVETTIYYYSNLFSRLTKEVRDTGNLTRYVGYQSPRGMEGNLHFLGIEVENIGCIPPGMIAWDLSMDERSVWGEKNGRSYIISRENISWQWIEQSPSGSGRPAGEFTDVNSKYWVSANSYVDMQKANINNDEIELISYDNLWPQQFTEMSEWLTDILGPDVVLNMEHYGSTAIQGMLSKPIIDLLVEIPSFSKAKRRAVPILNNELWEYWWYRDHMVFVKRNQPMGRRTHHIHMASRGHDVWQGIIFRDYLRTHKEEASRYAALKAELSATHSSDRERYTAAKTEFVRKVLLLAQCR